MNPLALKKGVLEAARERLKVTAQELQDRIKDLNAVTIGDDNAESASQTESTRGSDVDLIRSLGAQFRHIQEDLDRLEKIDPAVQLDVVQYGAVVHTDKRSFLIGASVEAFEAAGRTYLGVTPKAALIQALMGMEKGETADYDGVPYAIEDIY